MRDLIDKLNEVGYMSTNYASRTRQATNKILELVEEGILDKDTVIQACLGYMSEDEVADMAHKNEFFMGFDDEEAEMDSEDDPMDDYNYHGHRMHY